MKIGIDIDGVLTDIEQWQLDYGSKFYYEKYGKEIINYKGFETNDNFDVEKKDDDEFWYTYFRDYSKNIEVRKFAVEIIDKLHNEGNDIYIITARSGFALDVDKEISQEENRSMVLKWLKDNGIYYDKIIFSLEDKLKVCKEEQIDIMIDDRPENIEQISKEIPVICFHANYNEHCKGKNIYRCYSWYDIYCKIKKIESENKS